MDEERDGLNHARLHELAAVDGTGAMLSGVIDAFEQTCDAALELLADQLAHGSAEDAREGAHALAGRALMVGAQEAGERMRALEQIVVGSGLEPAREAWPETVASFARARAALAAYRTG